MFKWIFTGLLIFSTAVLAETKTYKIEGMTCEGCVKTLNKKVSKLKGLEKFEAKVGELTVTSKGAIDEKAAQGAIEAAGFKVATGEVAASGEKKSCSGDSENCEHCKEKHAKGESCDHKKHKEHKHKKKGA